MKKLAVLMLPFLILGAMAAAGCGKTPGGNTTVSGPVDHVDLTVARLCADRHHRQSGDAIQFR